MKYYNISGVRKCINFTIKRESVPLNNVGHIYILDIQYIYILGYNEVIGIGFQTAHTRSHAQTKHLSFCESCTRVSPYGAFPISHCAS